MAPTAASSIDAKPSLLGECVVYLGVLNYFFTADEVTPVVSRIGTVIGRLQLRITPYVAVAQRASSKRLEDEFVPYERVDVDSSEEQVHEYMDRPLQYRVELLRLSQVAPQRFSHLSLRYTFFRETSTQTPRFQVDANGDSGPLGLEFRHVVDVSDALVKFWVTRAPSDAENSASPDCRATTVVLLPWTYLSRIRRLQAKRKCDHISTRMSTLQTG